MAIPLQGTTIPDARDVPIDVGVGDNTVNPEHEDVQAFINAVCPPDTSVKPTYHTTGPNNGEIDFVEYFKGPTQTTPNRIARVDVTYVSGDPTSEVWKLYSAADGTTIKKTVTFTHTWVSNDLTKTTTVTT